MNKVAMSDALAAWQHDHPTAGQLTELQDRWRWIGVRPPMQKYAAEAGEVAGEVVRFPGLEPYELVVRASASGELAFVMDEEKFEYRFFREPAAARDGRVLVVRIYARGVDPPCRGNPEPIRLSPDRASDVRAIDLGTTVVTQIRVYTLEYQWTNASSGCPDLMP
jgi:hypothetical protein